MPMNSLYRYTNGANDSCIKMIIYACAHCMYKCDQGFSKIYRSSMPMHEATISYNIYNFVLGKGSTNFGSMHDCGKHLIIKKHEGVHSWYFDLLFKIYVCSTYMLVDVSSSSVIMICAMSESCSGLLNLCTKFHLLFACIGNCKIETTSCTCFENITSCATKWKSHYFYQVLPLNSVNSCSKQAVELNGNLLRVCLINNSLHTILLVFSRPIAWNYFVNVSS